MFIIENFFYKYFKPDHTVLFARKHKVAHDKTKTTQCKNVKYNNGQIVSHIPEGKVNKVIKSLDELVCTKFLKEMSDFEEELFLTQSSFSDSLEARSRQLNFLCDGHKSDSLLGCSELNVENAVSDLFDVLAPVCFFFRVRSNGRLRQRKYIPLFCYCCQLLFQPRSLRLQS